jgi:hypothetical protein
MILKRKQKKLKGENERKNRGECKLFKLCKPNTIFASTIFVTSDLHKSKKIIHAFLPHSTICMQLL